MTCGISDMQTVRMADNLAEKIRVFHFCGVGRGFKLRQKADTGGIGEQGESIKERDSLGLLKMVNSRLIQNHLRVVIFFSAPILYS